jgi:hypothetical protein
VRRRAGGGWRWVTGGEEGWRGDGTGKDGKRRWCDDEEMGKEKKPLKSNKKKDGKRKRKKRRRNGRGKRKRKEGEDRKGRDGVENGSRRN